MGRRHASTCHFICAGANNTCRSSLPDEQTRDALVLVWRCARTLWRGGGGMGRSWTCTLRSSSFRRRWHRKVRRSEQIECGTFFASPYTAIWMHVFCNSQQQTMISDKTPKRIKETASASKYLYKNLHVHLPSLSRNVPKHAIHCYCTIPRSNLYLRFSNLRLLSISYCSAFLFLFSSSLLRFVPTSYPAFCIILRMPSPMRRLTNDIL